MKSILLLTTILASTLTMGAEFKNITCKYSESYRASRDWDTTKFHLQIASFKVQGPKSATLDYAVVMDIFNEGETWIDKNKNLSNVKYNGRKYNNHVKFPLELTRVSDYNGSSGAWADLIISKEVTSNSTDQYGATLDQFDAVLDLSYDDHHGDYVQLTCTRRYFNR